METVNGSRQARVIAEMRRRIITGEAKSGALLSEIALAEELGVSRTPVREALKQLQTEGLVEIRPRVGTFVSAPSRRDITELFEMKELLEGAAARLLAPLPRVPRSTSTTSSPARRRNHAHHAPIVPPPTTTASALVTGPTLP